MYIRAVTGDIFVNENENKNEKYRQSFTKMRTKNENYFENENRILTLNKKTRTEY